jgi:hypothetical protein
MREQRMRKEGQEGGGGCTSLAPPNMVKDVVYAQVVNKLPLFAYLNHTKLFVCSDLSTILEKFA